MKAFPRFMRYCLVALLAASGDWLVFIVLVSAVGLPPLVGLMTSRVAGGLLSFLTNRHWTWRNNHRIALTQQGRRFVLLYVISYLLSVALFQLLTKAAGVPIFPAKLVTDLSCFLVNFLVMNAYVYHARLGFTRLFLQNTDQCAGLRHR